MTDVVLSKRARKRFSGLESELEERIKDALREINPDRDLRHITNENVYSFRVGDYRVICDWDKVEDKVYVLTVGHRRNVYDREF